MDFHVSVLGHTLDFFPTDSRAGAPDNTPLIAAALGALVPLFLRDGKSRFTAHEDAALQRWGFWLQELGKTPNLTHFPDPPHFAELPTHVQPFAAAINVLWGHLELQADDARDARAQSKPSTFATIIVNDEQHPWFAEVASRLGILLLTTICDKDARVTYKRGPDGAEGALRDGETVEVVNDMVFTVAAAPPK